MFSIEEVLSQGDKSLEIRDFSSHLDDQCYLNQDFVDLEFLDSFTGKSDLTSTDMNLDLKELLAEEFMDISFNVITDVPTEIPVSEFSYNLNNTVQGELISLEAAVPLEGVSSHDLKTLQHQESDSFEISGSSEVSSTTNTLFDLLEERTSLNNSLFGDDDDDVHDLEESEISTESVAGKKYLEMRRKNNIASQRSRKIRKLKNSKMSGRLKELEKENKELLSLAEELEKERNTLQELLLSIISKKS